MKQQFLKAKTDTIRLTVYQDNRPSIPSSATITLLTPGGTELQAAVAVTAIDGTTGEMTYSLTASHTATHDLNYRAEWAYVVSGVTYYEQQLFDVVKSILSIPITDDDIYNELPSLRQEAFQGSGTATAGAAGSLTDTAKRKESNDFWKGGTIEILSGTGVGQVRDITTSTQSSGIIAVSPNFATTPDTTSVYRIVKSFSLQIQQAFKRLETMLYNKGQRHSLILESSQIEIPLLNLVIHHICLDLRGNIDDQWDLLAKDYQDKFDKSYNGMKVDYDADESLTIDDEEAQRSVNGFTYHRA